MLFGNEPYVWVIVIVGVLGIPVLTSVALFNAATAAGMARRTATTVAVAVSAGLVGWAVTVALLARADAFRQDPVALRPWFPLAFAGAVVVPLLATRIPVLSRILATPGLPVRLVWPQALRVVGGVFLIALALGQLPAAFAVPAALGDLAVGLSAPLVARRATRARLVWFNILGLVDLVTAISLGFLAGLGPARLLTVTPSTAAATLLPLVLIPLAGVPLVATLHILSLRQLYAKRKTSHQRDRGNFSDLPDKSGQMAVG
jgi:hypothetical protein